MIAFVSDTRPELESELESELAIPCPICVAKAGERCAFITDASKYMPMSHAGRRRLAQTVKESQHA